MKLYFSLLFCLLAPAAQTPPARDPAAVLDEARARLQAMARNLEKYVCVETVNRSYFQPPASPGGAPRLESTDRVRLEVTVSEGTELHSWPGATRFDERNVDELIRNGPVSTGAFGGYLDSVFARTGARYQYQGEKSEGGKVLYQYRFTVPLEASHFDIKTTSGWRPTAYEGEFEIDPQTLDLAGLRVHTGDLPSGAPFCRATSTLHYQMAHIGDSDVLLPQQSQLDIELDRGSRTRNITTFAGCREYQAESEISFDSSAGTEEATRQTGGRGRVALPIGLPVAMALTAPIDTATAAAGDPVDAKLLAPVRRPGSPADLLPTGAVVRGRIRRVDHHLLPTPYFRLVLAFKRVDVGGVVSPFVVRSDPDAVVAQKLGVNLEPRDSGLFYWGVGTFLFPSNKDHIVIPAGFASKWFTLATGGR